MQKAWWTLLPVHGIATGKSRLAAVLDAPARAALNHHLLTHTLEMIAAWQGDLAQCLVVSPCAEALACAEAAGALTMREAAGGDLNAALRLGAQALARRGAQRLLVLACDLPRLSAPALDAFTAQATRAEQIVLAADRTGSGTNALAMPAGACELFHFGLDSRARHLAAFAQAGYHSVCKAPPELAFDLDTPQDYADWRAQPDARIPRAMMAVDVRQTVEAGK